MIVEDAYLSSQSSKRLLMSPWAASVLTIGGWAERSRTFFVESQTRVLKVGI